ncbi:PKD domain-containing protein [Flammeovirga sp. SJP92]|uniref:PKD domain-containing protein n=1 Tax=Flammeovirga sp. SJP92 TaxID=1775430 RepID=UPI000788D262|nr:PKD domain-containing protein [Flammeovirga sp. SJP92]KXX69584.1 hypothetical protein AVL50_16070 [Flammeovirga sp. SJP92]
MQALIHGNFVGIKIEFKSAFILQRIKAQLIIAMLFSHKLLFDFKLCLLFFGLCIISCSSDDPADEIVGNVTVDAGPDQTVSLGDVVTLTGTGTDSQNDVVTFLWETLSIPSGSSGISLEDPTSAITKFTPVASGVYQFKLTGTNSNGKTGDDTIEITVGSNAILPEEIGGVISSDRTLVNRIEDPTLPDYIASSDVILEANLIIEAGVMIVFKSETGIDVTASGSLKAEGTAEEAITLTGTNKIKGAWKGLNILSNSANNKLAYVTVDYAGQKGFDGANHKAGIMINNASSISITHSTIINADGTGIYLRDKTSSLTAFSENTISNNSTPITAQLHHFHFFDINSDYTGNTDDYILGIWSATATDEDVTWMAINVPLRLADNIENIESNIAIEAGTEIIGINNSGLAILEEGSLNAVGTTDQKIIFRGDENLPGKWRGLSFHSNNTSNELTYVEISNGGQKGFDGGDERANIMVDGNGRLKMTHTKSYNSGGYGLFTRTNEAVLVDFANNTFTQNTAPVMSQINHYHYFDSNSDYTGNTNDYIDSYWSATDVTGDATWQALNVPYRLSANIERIDASITINAGAQFVGQEDSGLEIQNDAALTSNGTSVNPVVFSGSQDIKGYWRGLRFLSNTLNNKLSHTQVMNGGQKGFDGGNRKANIEVGEGASLTIDHCMLSKSGDVGIRVQEGGNLTESNTTFSDLEGIDIDQ